MKILDKDWMALHELQKKNSINLTENSKTKFCLNLHYNRENSYLFINGTEIHKFKAKDSEIVAKMLCLQKTFSR